MSEEKKVVAQEAKTEVSEVKNTVDEAVITEQAVASMLATVGAEAKTSQPKADEGKPRQTKGTLLRRLVGPLISGAIEEAIAQQVNELFPSWIRMATRFAITGWKGRCSMRPSWRLRRRTRQWP